MVHDLRAVFGLLMTAAVLTPLPAFAQAGPQVPAPAQDDASRRIQATLEVGPRVRWL